MDYPIFSLQADVYRKLPKLHRVINLLEFEPTLWVGIPHYLNLQFNFAGVYFLTRNSDDDDIEEDITLFCEREPFEPWIKIPSDILCKEVGMHEYRVQLINRFSNDPLSLYFSYTVQDDNPPQPYNYMKEIRDAWNT